ncbi:MAG TPA: serine/threonine-protein kinase [Kofleriaceae bacterium]|nr:serine/threonine-protein kinase [Kofleriaceae bacterium]
MSESPRSAPGGAALPAALGDFAIVGLLGEGGSGTVYDARWGHRRIALKVLRDELVPTAKERERFFAEAALLQAVDHAGVVKVLGSGTLPDGRPYLAMEHLDGESLAARIARGPMAVEEAMALFAQLCAAVQALHARGLIHRDVKPENVILTGTFAVLLDFGIAKPESAPASTVTQEGSVRGTPAYMAPERFFGQPAGVATDVYELGVVFFAMVTGRLPWDSPLDPAGRLNPAAPSQLGVALPGDLEMVLLRALSTRAEARPMSVTALLQQMQAAIHAAPTASGEVRETVNLRPPPPAVTPRGAVTPAALATTAAVIAAPRPRRRRLLVAAAALAVLAAGVTSVVLVTRSSPSPSPSPDPIPSTSTSTSTSTGTSTSPSTKTPAPKWPAEPATIDAKALDTMLSLHPADTMVLIAASPRRLVDSPIVSTALADNKDAEGLKVLRVLEAACGFDDVLRSIELVTLGAAEAKTDVALDLVIRGDLPRDRVEKCLTDLIGEEGAPGKARRKGAVTRLTGGKDALWLGWRDPHTLFVTTRDDVDDAWVKQRLAARKRVGGADLLPPLLSEVDTGAAVWAVAQPPEAGGSPIPGTEPPRALYASLLVKKEIALRAGLRYDRAEDAAETARVLTGQLAEFARDPIAAMLISDAAFGVEGQDAVFTMSIGETMAAITMKSLVELLGK